MRKQPRLLLGIAVILTIWLSGCTRCVTCDSCPSGVQLENNSFCENEFASASDYEQAIDIAEGFGCTCVEE